MRRLTILLADDVHAALIDRCRQEDRPPERQAAWLIRQALSLTATHPAPPQARPRELVTAGTGPDRPEAA